ncbi:MAG: two-component sensor histidine kinase [Subtercola sp.]|nr:two-component sensor histidine kinase [Subtercola sp.]
MSKSRRPVAPPPEAEEAGRRAASAGGAAGGMPGGVLAGIPGSLVDDAAAEALRLPRPPGVFRLFFSRHPWFVDGVLVALFVLPATLLLTLDIAGVTRSGNPLIVSLLALVGAAALAVALLFRRAHPFVLVGVVGASLFLVFPAFGGLEVLPAIFSLYTVAVYASVRAAWVSFGILAILLAVASLIASRGLVPDALAMSLSLGFLMLIATLIGVNVGNRKRYVQALLDRAAQLARERDQQALLATISERARIAREMHDIVAHSLTVMVALADGADLTAERDPIRAREAMRQVAETGRTALADMRVVLGVLAEPVDAGAPQSLGAPLAPQPGHEGLEPLIQSYRGAGMVVHFTVAGAPSGDTALQVMIYRVLQEALTNSLRYAPNPKHVSVALNFGEREIRLIVNDVGQSQHGTPSIGSGRGIIGMRERVAVFGGTLEAGPTTAGGWQVLAHVPLERVGAA